MLSESDSPNKPMNPLSQLVQSIFSDNSNIMLAAIISLILVILFVLLLHVYARWFLAQAQAGRRRRRRNSVTFSGVLGPARFHHFHNITMEDSPISSSQGKGLDSAIIAAIPMFIYEVEVEEGDEQNKRDEELECVICLSAFEDGEIGRGLPKCGHAFHVECIDMWLDSHSNCPICRAPIVGGIVVHNQNDYRLGSVDGDDASSTVLEIATDTPSYEISESEHGNEREIDNGGVSGSISETSSWCSLKRMLGEVFLSSNVNEIDA